MNSKGWKYYKYQIKVVEEYFNDKDVLVIAPTGAGKTIAGFLPSIIDISEKKINNDTIVFNNLINLKADLANNWEVPISRSWHKKLMK